MRIVKKGKLPVDRAWEAAEKFKDRVVCETCKSVLEFDANDLKIYVVHGKLKVVCPFCKNNAEVDEGGVPPNVLAYVKMLANGEIKIPVRVA